MPDLADFERLASNLFALEINTIVKANMTGEKFPAPAQALTDIASDYEAELATRVAADAVADAPLVVSSRQGAGSAQRFDAIATRADALLGELAKDARTSPDIKASYLMVCRIRDNARLLSPIAAAMPNAPTHAQLSLIRKVWELGTEEIAFQTVIQLDGNVVTRLQPKYAQSAERIVHGIHGEAVGVSVGFWKSLVELVETFFGVTVRAFTGKG